MSDRTYAEALSLDSNDVFHSLLDSIEEDARDALVTTDAENTARIRDHQAMARAVVEIRGRLAVILATNAPKTKPGLA